jgi:carbonic anhydrase
LLAACNSRPAPEAAQLSDPEAVLQLMMDGNARFASVHSIHPDESARRSREVSQAQHPMAVVIACSDSRVSPELVFDEGLGDLFVIRTAGNIISEMELASVEYAVEHFKVPLVVIMGHERCGAVQALVDNETPHGHVSCIIDSLRNEEEIQAIPLNDINRLEDCIKANISHGLTVLRRQSDIIAHRVAAGQLKVVGVHYDLDDRTVSLQPY